MFVFPASIASSIGGFLCAVTRSIQDLLDEIRGRASPFSCFSRWLTSIARRAYDGCLSSSSSSSVTLGARYLSR